MSILKIHDTLFDFLTNYQNDNPGFYFLPRMTNKYMKLDKGYWFLGNDDYLAVTFWTGGDGDNKTPNISFIILPPKSKDVNARGCYSFIQFTSRDNTTKAKFLNEMANSISGFKPFKNKGELYKPYSSIIPIKNLKQFLSEDKPKIDEFIGDQNIESLSLLNSDSLKYVEKIKILRGS